MVRFNAVHAGLAWLIIALYTLNNIAKAAVVPFSKYPWYGVQFDSFPSTEDRLMLAWLNAARDGGGAFVKRLATDDTYKRILNITRSLGPALRWDLNLNRAARAHLANVASVCPDRLPDSDCNGTLARDRVASFYNLSSETKEYDFLRANTVSFGNFMRFTMVSIMCAGTDNYVDLKVSSCANDSAPAAATRGNISLSSWNTAGCAVSVGSPRTLASCSIIGEYSAGKTYSRKQAPIASGGHYLVAVDDGFGYFVFVATYDGEEEIISASVGGHSLSLFYGNATRGTWITGDVGSGIFTAYEHDNCDSYSFAFKSNKSTIYYPTIGSFKIAYEAGGCNGTDYVSTGGAPSCSMSLPKYATSWGTCTSSVLNTVSCAPTCVPGSSVVAGTCKAGTWSPTVPTCNPNPCYLNINVTGIKDWGTCKSTVSSGTSCNLKCSNYYNRREGSCLLGNWSVTPACIMYDCYPILVNGSTGYGTCNVNGTPAGTNCSLDCSKGYTPFYGFCFTIDDATFLNGGWLYGAPSCNPNPCEMVSLPTAATGWGSCNYSVASGTTCAVSCQSGYTAKNGKCFAGSWSSLPSCIQTDCFVSLPLNASSWGTCSTIVKNATNCSFDCPYGVEQKRGKCSSGVWVPATPSCGRVTNCSISLPKNATGWGSCSPSIANASSCAFDCPHNVEQVWGKCNDTKWLSTMTSSLITGPLCGEFVNCSLQIDSNAIGWGSCASDVSKLGSCKFRCRNRYISSAGTCNAKGAWDPLPACIAPTLSCMLEFNKNASTWGSCDAIVFNGENCSFNCFSGYSATKGECVNGSWTNVPLCVISDDIVTSSSSSNFKRSLSSSFNSIETPCCISDTDITQTDFASSLAFGDKGTILFFFVLFAFR